MQNPGMWTTAIVAVTVMISGTGVGASTNETTATPHWGGAGEAAMHGRRAEWMRGEGPGPLERIVSNPKLAAEMGLTADQIAKMKMAWEDLRQQAKELRAGQETSGMDQAKLLSSEAVDEDAVMAAVERAGKAHTELAKLKVKQLLVLRNTLTPEQRAKVKEIIGQRAKEGRENKMAGKNAGGTRETPVATNSAPVHAP